MFEKATRLKLRFDSPKGPLSTEDLWDLPLTSNTGKANLDDVAKGVYIQLKDTGEAPSFVEDAKKGDDILQLKLDILKHIIGVRKAENAARLAAQDRQAEAQKIMALIQEKKNNALSQESIEELEARLATLTSA